MGGMVVLLARDFSHILPVITKGTPADEINACLNASTLWVHVKKMCLNTKMRVHRDRNADQYAVTLLKIGGGRMAIDSDGMIPLHSDFCNIFHDTDDLINKVYSNLLLWVVENGCVKEQF